MDLPRDLWPWRQSLSIFPRELAIALGGIVDRLALVIGPLASPDSAGSDQPDGIGGVGRRGSFERLLATDWALAEEAPLEFLRRVSTGELSFLEIAHQKPTVARQSVVLFDVGPDQRGAPRIAHLALLVLLAQRAQAGGASFSWGILQGPTGELATDVNEESVRRLVQGGSQRRVEINDMIKFSQSWQDDQAEIWFVGGYFSCNAMVDVTPFRIAIEDSLDPDAPANLDVTVFGPKGKPKTIMLELPKGNTAVRLIRDPFRVARAAPQKTAVVPAHDANIVLSRDDRLLFFCGQHGELCTIPLPNSPNYKDLPKPRTFRPPPEERIIAVGRLTEARTIGVATRRGDEVVFHRLSHRMSASVLTRQYAVEYPSRPRQWQHVPPWLDATHAPAPLGQLFQLGKDNSLFLHDGRRMLFTLDKDTLQIFDFPTPLACQTYNGLSWLLQGEQYTWNNHDGTKHTTRRLPPDTQRVWPMTGGLLLLQLTPQRVRVVDSEGVLMHERELPAGVELLGAMHARVCQFYVLDSTRMQILCIEDDKTATCVKFSAPIRAITASVSCWLIAYLTEENELCVYAREYNTLILRMRLGEP